MFVEGLWRFWSAASVASPAQRLFFAVNAGTVLLSEIFDAFILVASAASLTVGATQTIISMSHVMHLAAGGDRTRKVFLANITMEWIARDTRARFVHTNIAVLPFAASTAHVAVQSTEVDILLLMAHVMQPAARDSCAW